MSTISKPEQIFDARLIERHVNSGRITRKDVEQHLKQLPDVGENALVIPKDTIFEVRPHLMGKDEK